MVNGGSQTLHVNTIRRVLEQPGPIPVEAQHSKVLLLVCFIELNLEAKAHIYVC